MIKQLSPSDISVRPFTTYKNWRVQSTDSSSVDQFGNPTYFAGKFSLNEGLNISGTFYDSGSRYYNNELEPTNSSGEYKRITYASVQSMFYNDFDNPLKLFGVELIDRDPVTRVKEERVIRNRVLVGKLGHQYWGEKIAPTSVQIIDNSNLHEPYLIFDDGCTNLYISGSEFPTTTQIRPQRFLESRSFWNTASGQFYFNGIPISYAEATNRKNVGYEVTYVPDSGSWYYDETYARDYYQADNERFGQSVSAWYKYIVAGAPMDADSFAAAKQGHVQLFKYDEAAGQHRFVKKIFSPFTQNGFAQEIGNDNSLLVQLEDGTFPFIDLASDCTNSSRALTDGFGSAVSIKDNSMAIGSPAGNESVSCTTHAGFVYVHDKYKGGADNWGLVSILEGKNDGDCFGEAVSIDGTILAIGAPGANLSSGAVYVFRRKQYMGAGCDSIPTSSLWYRITGEGGTSNRIVSEDGTGLAGETGTPTFVSGNYQWELETVLTSSVSSPSDFFGSSLEVNNDRIIVGCRRMLGEGYAALFTSSYTSASIGACPTASWQEYRLFAGNDDSADLDPLSPFNTIPASLPFNGYGRKVAMDGDHILVCSYFDKSFIPFVGSPDVNTIGAAYFYSYSLNKNCNLADCALRYKTFGDRSTIINNNFARDVSVRGGRAVVSSWPDKTWYSASYDTTTNRFNFECESDGSTSGADQIGTLGRVSFFDFEPKTLTWDRFKSMKRSKEIGQPSYVYGHSCCLSSVSSGSKFLVVGAPVFSYSTTSESYSHLSDKNLQRSGSFPGKYSGSLYVYDMDTFEVDPLIGNVFYRNGCVVLTNTSSNYVGIMTGTGSRGFELNYRGTHTIFEHEYLISMSPGEFNYSTNARSLVNYPITFDVNQDGVFDFADIDLIMRFLNKQKFTDVYDTDDNGLVLEGDTLNDESWWNSDIVMTEAGDVLLNETVAGHVPITGSFLTRPVHEYIQTKLIDTGVLDIDGNGIIDTTDGIMLLNYWSKTLTDDVINRLLDSDSTRRYYADLRDYMQHHTGELNGFLVDPNFTSYQYSSSYDTTGSYLAPYITAIGLYDEGELVMVAKLGRPIKSLVDWPLNIIVRFDT